MRFAKLLVPALIIPTLFACGVSDSTALTDIDSDLWAKICDKATAGNADETFTCDDVEFTVEATTSAECQEAGNALSASSDCSATFGDWKECQEWEPTDPCDFEEEPPASCTALVDCLMADM